MTDETPHIPETLAQYLTENQDPQQVARIYEKVSQLLTRGEQVTYIAVQKRQVHRLHLARIEGGPAGRRGHAGDVDALRRQRRDAAH
jgi:hypothetical protein